MRPGEQSKPIRALLGLFSLLARRKGREATLEKISTATEIGRTRLQRLSGAWRGHLPCPPLDIVEAHAIAAYAATVLKIDARPVGRWLSGFDDGRERQEVVNAIRKIAKEAVERQVTLADVELPAALAELLTR